MIVAGTRQLIGDIIRSTDYGETWTNIGRFGNMTEIMFVENDAVEGLWAGGGEGPPNTTSPQTRA